MCGRSEFALRRRRPHGLGSFPLPSLHDHATNQPPPNSNPNPNPAPPSPDCGAHNPLSDWLCPSEHDQCAASHEECLTSKCCKDSLFGCFKRPFEPFAACLSKDEALHRCSSGGAVTPATADWVCPGAWERPAEQGGDCSSSHECEVETEGCYRRRSGPGARCRPRAAADCADSPDWLCPGSWKRCTRAYGDCSSTKCCGDAGFGCHRKSGSQVAQCLPLPPGGEAACVDTPEWLCPRAWGSCALSDFGDCRGERCCASPGFACYKGAVSAHATCRPIEADCLDTPDWICPNQWEHCAGDYADCLSSQCCSSPGFLCKRKPHVYSPEVATCRPDPNAQAGRACVDTGEWQCPGAWEQCSRENEWCGETACCRDPGYACYRTGYRARLPRCLKRGSCEALDSGAAAHPMACTILGEDPPPSLPPPPAPPSPPRAPPGTVRDDTAEMQHALDALKQEQRFAEEAAAVGAGLGLLVVLLLLCVLICLGRHMAAREKRYAGMMKLRTDGGSVAEMTGSGAAALPPGALA